MAMLEVMAIAGYGHVCQHERSAHVRVPRPGSPFTLTHCARIAGTGGPIKARGAGGPR
jgi:hypothetical protein